MEENKRGKRRKLIRLDKLQTLADLAAIGVPVQRAMRDLGIDMSRPAAAKLLEIYSKSQTPSASWSDTTRASIAPSWLDPNGLAVQEQPKNWVYVGYFPFGYWTELSE